MSYRRAGMHVDSRCPFRFLHLWQRRRVAFVRSEDTERSRLEPELAAAIRVIVHDPFTLVGPMGRSQKSSRRRLTAPLSRVELLRRRSA
ncbi:hypothetical protein SAMN02745121_07456 [Nannocystis exedens]|uniref:Uncharacterized protein n=1 Tax=Nannocystis exedens TaxID=54 RepID=A0A1I2GT89_9BACT|nr:hypothetical protein NAEX_01776 [Nannocystis exedens]SFF19771.1 hypothetical protein SAMN02745121_07456 [Nannocystis exedens]